MFSRSQCIDRLFSVAPYIQNEFGVKSLCLFGSMARGDYGPDSDVDICVDMPPRMVTVMRLKSYLETLIGVSVDLVRLHKNINHFTS